MSTGNPPGRSRRELRKAKKLALARQQAWEEIRARQEVDRAPGNHGAQRPHAGSHRPPLVGPTVPGAPPVELLDTHAAVSQVAARRRGTRTAIALLGPCVSAFVLVLLLVAGTPLVDDTWSLPWLAGTAVAGIATILLQRGAAREVGRAPRATGLVVGGIVLLAGIAGIIGQNVVEGRAQLRGSDVDRAVEEHRELERTLVILTENQGLLTLPPEQAIPLGSVYAAARQQAIAIGERWNPATRPVPPLPELATVYELVNIAAAQQAAAFDGFVANLENPEPAVEAGYVERALAVDALLRDDIPAALEAVDRAIRRSVTSEVAR